MVESKMVKTNGGSKKVLFFSRFLWFLASSSASERASISYRHLLLAKQRGGKGRLRFVGRVFRLATTLNDAEGYKRVEGKDHEVERGKLGECGGRCASRPSEGL